MNRAGVGLSSEGPHKRPATSASRASVARTMATDTHVGPGCTANHRNSTAKNGAYSAVLRVGAHCAMQRISGAGIAPY